MILCKTPHLISTNAKTSGLIAIVKNKGEPIYEVWQKIETKTSPPKTKKVPRSAQHILNLQISSLINQSLRGYYKHDYWEILVGYTVEELRAHLESKFTDGMTWRNYGRWHIDHRMPRCAFSFESPSDKGFKDCWALSNLQPLWAHDNNSKGRKINPDYKPKFIYKRRKSRAKKIS